MDSVEEEGGEREVVFISENSKKTGEIKDSRLLKKKGLCLQSDVARHHPLWFFSLDRADILRI